VQAEIITVGDEILIGQTIDTNSAWMGQKLNEVGVDVHRVVSIRDTGAAIVNALESLDPKTRIVLITGGLGPTKDDLTKHTLTEYFGGELIFNQPIFEHIQELFRQIGRDISHLNRDQAFLPSNCKVLQNNVGTASGMRFEKDGRYIISMPGVPFEMKFLMREHILPWIGRDLMEQDILHRTFLTQGIPESLLAERISDWETNLPSELKLAYLPSPGIVKLRLTAKGDKANLLPLFEEQELKLRNILGKAIYGTGASSLQEVLGQMLMEKSLSLSTAESCTGGYIAHLLTSIAGSSNYFKGSIVAYSNEVKQAQLGVKNETIERVGAVSEEVVKEMAEGARERLLTDYAIAISGIAGPDGGSEEKPVGTVWIAIAGPDGCRASLHRFGKHRDRNIKRSALMALDLLRQRLME
jgi:nicotinamide-nucleotide amidase